MYTFCVQGVVHHFIGSLVPNSDETPAFVQIYIYDGTPEAEVENRQRYLGETKLPELRALQQMLHDVNPYVYRLMIRSGSNHLHLSGRLFHQYIVDMYGKIEQHMLYYI